MKYLCGLSYFEHIQKNKEETYKDSPSEITSILCFPQKTFSQLVKIFVTFSNLKIAAAFFFKVTI